MVAPITITDQSAPPCTSPSPLLGLTLHVHGAPLEMKLRLRDGPDGQVKDTAASWDPHKTALIACDMWDSH
jgi:hypothetical protein